MPQTLDIEKAIQPDALAVAIADKAHKWKIARAKKEDQWKEIRNYVFATDTRTTSNAVLPWRNTTTRPKLCQIRDNLHANYMAAIFPSDNWFQWVAANSESATAAKARAIENYMRSKLRDSQFREFVSKAIYDYIDYGNCFGDVEFVNYSYKLKNGETRTEYVGPKAIRISPLDIVFDVTSPSFERSPKIQRVLLSYGDIQKRIESFPPGNREVYQKTMARVRENRLNAKTWGTADLQKQEAFIADGFGSILDYYASDMVEFLYFEGDWYDVDSGTLYTNHRIVVVDRAYVVENEPIDNWLGKSSLVHAGWRLRPDNLIAMGPLDNLVGMQYRIDHLENLKADVFDLVAFPVMKHKGYVEDWTYAPGERIFCAEDADVEALVPDTTALTADQQIYELQMQMEEMAGAPKQAMGIRTPGEKTAFEVSELATAASRMFENKVAHFEEMFIEPILNYMLEVARRNLNTKDVVGVIDDDYGVVEFMTITAEDLKARGKLVPMGARHFATKNKIVQNLVQLTATGAYQDPGVSVHFSGWRMAKLLEDTLDLDGYGIVQKNVRVAEQMETQELANAAQEQLVATSMAPTEAPDDADLRNEVEAPPAQ